MKRLQLPFFDVGGEDGLCMVFLPGLKTEELKDVVFKFSDEEEDLLQVYCIYEANGDEPDVDYYPIDIHEDNRDLIESMDNLIVEHHAEYEPDELTDDPDQQQNIRQLFEELGLLEQLMGRKSTDPE